MCKKVDLHMHRHVSYIEMPTKLDETNNLTLLWTSEQRRITGSERADSLAKKKQTNFIWIEANRGSNQKIAKRQRSK